MKYFLSNILVLFLLFNFSCKNLDISKKETRLKIDVKKLTDNKVNSENPYLFSTDKEIILSWVESDKNKLKFSFFDKSLKKFSKIKHVKPAIGLQMHAESMAKIGVDKNGILYAIYRRKSTDPQQRFGGLIYYSTSNDKGETWSNEQKLVTDTSSTSQSFFDIALLADGNLGVIWLDSRKPIDKNHKGKTIYFNKTKLGEGFQIEKAIAGSTCECCRTDLFIDNHNNINIAYRNIIDVDEPNFDGIGSVEIRDMYFLHSKDNGITFSKPQAISKDNWHISGCPHTGPTMASNKNELAAVWFTGANDKGEIYYTRKVDEHFKQRKLLTNKGRHPQMISILNKYYIVYEQYYEYLEKGYSKIVLEIIDDDNKRKKVEISRPYSNNNHAVIIPINNQSILISWVNKDIRNSKIEYKIIKI